MDYEKQIEETIIAVFTDDTTLDSFAKRRWQDKSQKAVYPMIAVYADSDPDETSNFAELWQGTVNIQAETYREDDKNRAVIDNMIKHIRENLTDKGGTRGHIKTRLNAKFAEININGIRLMGGTYETDNEKLNINQIKLNLYFENK